MSRRLFFTGTLLFIFSSIFAQAPQGFNYQAVARDGSGNLLVNQTIQVRITVQSTEAGGTIFWQELHSGVTTNVFGLINLVIGTGVRQTASTVTNFSDINWNVAPKYIKTEIDRDGWKALGSAKLWSVPYSLVAEKANGLTAGSKLSVTSSNDSGTEALFEVKRNDGQTVFAVYPDAVNVYVPQSAKGVKGGFAVGGFDGSKGTPQDYLRVTPDSVRIYIDPAPAAKGVKGGFAVGGYGAAKGINDMYFNLTGASAVNTVDASPQVLWYPNKNAFLAGNVHIGAVDSVGNYSTALGYQSIAMGNYSQAFGYRAKALGDFSTSIGKNSVAGSKSAPLANNAFAFGNGARATGDDSYALGSGSTASGFRSFAYGYNSTASNTNSLALGNGTIASGTNAVALGYQSQSQGDKSIAIGSFYSTSFMIPIINLGKGGEEEGSKGEDDFLVFRPLTPLTTFSRTFNRANIAQGQYSIAIGNGNLAQNGGLVFGSNSTSAKFGALALGNSAEARETNSTAIGYNTIAKGVYSVAIGNNLYANSFGELALGQWNDTIAGNKTAWNENDMLFTIGNGVNSSNKSNALTIYKNGKTIIRGKYAVSTFNYSKTRLVLPGFVFKDYIYGIYTNLNRDNTAIEYYYSGWFGATGTAGTYYGLYADTRSGGSIDVAEYIYDSSNNTEPADVVVADPQNKESVIKSSKPYQSSVLGIISTKPHMTMGMELVVDEKTGEPLKDAKPATRLALTGRVPVKVTSENGPIVPGDLLTTSSTSGHAMKWTLLDVSKAKDFDEMKAMLAENERRRNAVVGKAVEAFSGSGSGKIVALISLQ